MTMILFLNNNKYDIYITNNYKPISPYTQRNYE